MKRTTKQTKAGRKVLAALGEIRDALDSGRPLAEQLSVRQVEVPEPGDYDARAVRATRNKLGVSQPVFAKLVGVSAILEQFWEQGKRFPDGSARRLLDEINRDPLRWSRMIRVISELPSKRRPRAA